MLPCGQEPVYAIEDRGPRPPGPFEISARTSQRASVHRPEATAPGGSAGAAASLQTEVPWCALPLTVTQPTLLACADWLRESTIPLGPIPRRYDRVVARAGTTIWWLTDQDVIGGPRPLAAVEVPEPLRRAADTILAEQARSRLKTEVRRRRHDARGPMQQHGVGR